MRKNAKVMCRPPNTKYVYAEPWTPMGRQKGQEFTKTIHDNMHASSCS